MMRRSIRDRVASQSPPDWNIPTRHIVRAIAFASLMLAIALAHGESSAEVAAGANSVAVVPNDNDREWERRLRDEAPMAWAQHEEFYRHTKGSFAILHAFYPEGSSSAEPPERAEFAFNGQLIKEVDVVHKQGMDLERVMAKNDLYAFCISKRAGDPQGRFAIEWLEKVGTDAESDKRIAFQVSQTEAIAFRPWRLYAHSLSDWAKTSAFAITRVAPVDSGTAMLVRAEFRGMQIGPSGNKVTVDGYADFDPVDHWVLREYLTRWPKGGTQNVKLEYGERQGGFPILTKRITIAGTKDNYQKITESFDGVRHETVSPDEFRLSYYGLPEPDFGSPSRRWLLWLFVNAGAICLAVGFFLWWHRRKAGLTG